MEYKMNIEAKENTIELPNAPKLKDLSFRLLQDARDLPEMVHINDSLREAGQLSHVTSLPDLTSWFQHPTNCEPSQDALFAQIAGEAVGYTRVWWEEEDTRPARIYYITLRVMPDWQGSGVDAAMLNWAENRLIKIAAQHPAGLERVFSSHLSENSTVQRALLESCGYQPARYFMRMRRGLENLPESPLPEGVEVRPMLPRDYRALWDASVEGFKDEWSSTRVTEVEYQRWLTSSEFQPLIWQIAWDTRENTIIGMVLNYIDPLENEAFRRFRGYTEGICVLPNWRGKGVARALICRSLAMMKALNMQEVALTVDSDNPSGAQRLYLGLGYQPYQTSLDVRKPMPPGQS